MGSAIGALSVGLLNRTVYSPGAMDRSAWEVPRTALKEVVPEPHSVMAAVAFVALDPPVDWMCA